MRAVVLLLVASLALVVPAAGALEIARVERADAEPGQPACLRRALRLAGRRERHVEVADEASRVGADDLAVAEQIDQTRAYGHADTVSSTASSALSTPAPSTSPVIPPRRGAMTAPIASAATSPTATTATPRPPSA